MELLRLMVNGGWSGLPTLKTQRIQNLESDTPVTPTDILSITKKNSSLRNVIRSHYLKHIAHVCRCQKTMLTKKMLFAESKRPY